MKSLADIAGLSQPTKKVAINYSFDVNPDAKAIQAAILSGEEPQGLIKATPVVIDNTGWRKADDKNKQYITDYYKSNPEDSLTPEKVATTKEQIGSYMASPLYQQRQANYPEQYSANISPDLNQEFQGYTANAKQQKRLSLLNSIPVEITKDSKLKGQFESDQDSAGKVVMTPNFDPTALAHELPHGFTDYQPALTEAQKESKAKNKGVLPQSEKIFYDRMASDEQNSSNFYDYKKGGKVDSSNVDPSLNKAEENKFIKLAKSINASGGFKGEVLDDDPRYKWLSEDPHYSKDVKNKTHFVQEQYSDLYGVRKLLLDNGITNSFGEDLDKDKMKKAMQNESITKDPVFRRFFNRYGEKNIIELNNTIAMNNQGMGNQNFMA